MYQVSEHDEFLLSQLLDGELPAEQAGDLQVRLRQEPALARAFEALRRVDNLVKAQRQNQPTVDFAGFHEQVMARIVAGGTEISEEDELLLNRMIDSELTAEDEALVLRRLAHEPALRTVYESLAKVNAALVQRRADAPEVNYNQLHNRVMKQVRKEAEGTGRRVRFPMWARVAAPLAAAAAIALSVWLHPAWQSPEHTQVVIVEQPSQPVQPEANPATPQSPEPQPITVVVSNAPVAMPAGVIEVAVGKPAVEGDGAAPMTVSVTKSAELAEAVRKSDNERSRQPSRKVLFATASSVQPGAAALAGDLF